MSFFSKDTCEQSISKSREKERPSTISRTRSPEAFSLEGDRIRRPPAKEPERLEQQPDMDIQKHHLSDDEHEPKLIRPEALIYSKDKLTIKPKKLPYDQKQQRISEGVTKQRSDYPTMEDIYSDWESVDETETSNTKKSKTPTSSKKQQQDQHQQQPCQMQQQRYQTWPSAKENQQQIHVKLKNAAHEKQPVKKKSNSNAKKK